MFEDILGKKEKTVTYVAKDCQTCASYKEGVDLPGSLKTIDICLLHGMKFTSGEVRSDCPDWQQGWPPKKNV